MANNKTTDIEIKTCTTNNTSRDRDIKKETDRKQVTGRQDLT